jgi:hypothetical protein
MAGSVRDFSYKDDSGKFHSVLIDESNAKSSTYSNEGLPATPLFLPAVTPFPGRITKGLIMRSVSCVDYLTGKVQKFWVGNPEAFEQLKIGGTFVQRGSEYFLVRSLSPERPPRPFLPPAYIDTGLDDGTIIGQ